LRAINHALTGAVIGLVIGEPVIAVPAALASHFICDVIPHYGGSDSSDDQVRSNWFRNLLVVDAVACLILVVLLAAANPKPWLLAAICAFVAAAPDLLSINRYLKIRGGHSWRPNLYSKFSGGIQWFERPIGAWVEVAWFTAAIIVLVPFLR